MSTPPNHSSQRRRTLSGPLRGSRHRPGVAELFVKPMSKRAIVILSAAACLLVVAVLGIKRAFEPPLPLEKVDAIREGMTEQEVRQILGVPTKIYPTGQWTYTRFLTFGYVNVLFGTDQLAMFAHYEEF